MVNTTEKLELPELAELIIYILSSEKKEALKKLRKEGVEKIKEMISRDSKHSTPYVISATPRVFRGLEKYIDKNTNNFILNPKKECSIKIFCV